jgi:nucleoside-diphosphate-sugar epimerase
MRIILTGSSGFMGSQLLINLLSKGHEVLAPVRSQSMNYINVNHPSLKLIKGNFFDSGLFKQYQDFKPEAIIHLASIRGEGHGSWEDYFKINVEGTQRLARFAVEMRVRLFIYCSTVGVYGTVPAQLPAGLQTPLLPDNNYHRSKYEAEQQIISLLQDQIPYVILRPTITYGKGDDGFPAKLINLVRSTKFPLIRKTVKIHLLNIETFIEVVFLFLNEKSKKDSIILLADHKPVKLSDLTDTIYAHFFSKPYPKLIRLPEFIYSFLKVFCRMFNIKSLYTSLKLISESWYYDVNVLSKTYSIVLRDTLSSMKSYMSEEFPQ